MNAFQKIGRFNFFSNIVCCVLNVAVAPIMFSAGGAFRIIAGAFLLAGAIYVFAAYVSWKTWKKP